MNVKQYIARVTSFIRAEDTKAHIAQELEMHLQQAKNAHITRGLTDEEAEQRAMEELGSASQLGQSLAKIHQPKIDWLMLSLFSLLLAASFLPIWHLDVSYTLRNAAITVLCIAIVLLCMSFNIQRFSAYHKYVFLAALMYINILALFSNYYVNGQMRLIIGPFVFAAIYAIPLLTITFAQIFAAGKVVYYKVATLYIVTEIFLYLSISGDAVYLFTTIVWTMLLFSRYSTRQKLAIFGSMAGLLCLQFVMLLLVNIRTGYESLYFRVDSFLHPEKYADGAGFMYIAIEEVVANGQWFGTSSGTIIPAGPTNFVLIHLIQQYGFAVTGFIVLLLLAVVWRIFILVYKRPISFVKLLLVGACALFTAQIVYSVAGVFGVVPIMPMSLPFISYGVYSSVISAFFIGLALSCYRRKSFIFQLKK